MDEQLRQDLESMTALERARAAGQRIKNLQAESVELAEIRALAIAALRTVLSVAEIGELLGITRQQVNSIIQSNEEASLAVERAKEAGGVADRRSRPLTVGEATIAKLLEDLAKSVAAAKAAGRTTVPVVEPKGLDALVSARSLPREPALPDRHTAAGRRRRQRERADELGKA